MSSRGKSWRSNDSMATELCEFVAAVASQPIDRVRRAKLIEKIEEIVQESLGSDAQILGYGSCFTDTAENSADVDATIYVPMSAKRARSCSNVTKSRLAMLRETASKCRDFALEVEENISRGTVTIGEAVSVHVERKTFRSYSTGRCILSCQRLLPLYGSHLVRREPSEERDCFFFFF